MYYNCGVNAYLCLAKSKDGLHFRKDHLEGASLPGTNVVLSNSVAPGMDSKSRSPTLSESLSLNLDDPEQRAARRFRGVARPRRARPGAALEGHDCALPVQRLRIVARPSQVHMVC